VLSNIMLGLGNALQPLHLIWCLIGLSVGTLFGALPGFSATMAVAVMVPFSYVMEPQAALLMLSGVYCGGVYGGSIPAILVGIPGTPASAPTAMEGQALVKKGRSGDALGMCTFASAIGGFGSAIALLLFSPLLAKIAMKVGAPESMMIALFGLSVVCLLSEGNMVKGVLIGFLSLLIGSIGQDPVLGFPRFTFGSSSLIGGLSNVPIMIGIYSMPQVFDMLRSGKDSLGSISDLSPLRIDFKDIKANIFNFIRSILIGIGIGIVPAAGPDVGAFVSYNEAKKSSKHPEEFGNGAVDGIIASEAANNAVTGGSLIPLITLSIPGSAPAAIFLGAMILHGMRPGPLLFTTQAENIYTIMVGFAVINIMLLFVGYMFCRMSNHILRIPQRILAILITALAIVGSYSINQNMMDVISMFVAGVIGWLLGKRGFSMSPVALSLLLGRMLEQNLSLTLSIYDNIFKIFTRPLTCIFAALTVVSIAFPFVRAYMKKHKVSAKS